MNLESRDRALETTTRSHSFVVYIHIDTRIGIKFFLKFIKVKMKEICPSSIPYIFNQVADWNMWSISLHNGCISILDFH